MSSDATLLPLQDVCSSIPVRTRNYLLLRHCNLLPLPFFLEMFRFLVFVLKAFCATKDSEEWTAEWRKARLPCL
jgi:hypothetical protein